MSMQTSYYSKLTRKFVLITVVCSLVPLLVVGWVINIQHLDSAENRVREIFRDRAAHHRENINLFLNERSSCIELVAQTHTLDFLTSGENLQHVFETLNREYDSSFTDLGIIGEDGTHLAYVGPYDLMDRNYSQTFWFERVTQTGVFISDMFEGFRRIPHFVIAVFRDENDRQWIIRATIDTEVFRALVEDVTIGDTGEVYLVNEDGLFQTRPRFRGDIMGEAPVEVGQGFEGIRVQIQQAGKDNLGREIPEQLSAHAWIDDPRWLLVVTQDYAEAFEDVNRTNLAILVLLLASALTILLVSIVTARHMVKVVKRRDVEAEELNSQLLQASKMASIGELSAGVAHEINNPLAIIMTERQILLDMVERGDEPESGLMDQLRSSLSKIQKQLGRCKRITQNLLRFSRRTKSVLEDLDINAFLEEIVDLMEREAGSSGIDFSTDLAQDLPVMLSDPSQLQQVFLNLIVNAIDAHEGKPYGKINISTRASASGRTVEVRVRDSGMGIRPENLGKIFDPFFTTKPVGKGTGLGLSLCYAMIMRLGGEISVESEPGEWTEFAIELPFRPTSSEKNDHSQSPKKTEATGRI